MPTKIGLDNLVYAIQTTEDENNVAPVYDVPVEAPGVMSIAVTPNASQETLFSDDGPMEVASTLGKIDVEIKKNELTTQQRADLLGHSIDADGALVYGSNDVAPYVAIGFRTLKSNGSYRYVWLYKGKFVETDDQNETKGDSINFQADTIKGQFLKLNYAQEVGGEMKTLWKYELDEDSETANAVAIANWFSDVKMPTDVASV